jgi:hypothetical protein
MNPADAHLFSLKLWGTVSGLFAGELMIQFGFSSTRLKKK